jgi:ketosteroid isomerase-like protein
MRSRARNRSGSTRGRSERTFQKSRKVNADLTIRRIGDEWARHWNAGDLDGVVAAYAEDAVYLPPHHGAVHGARRNSSVFENAP